MGLTARRTGPVFSKSELPPGGSPQLDSAYESWVTAFIHDEHDRWNTFLFIIHESPSTLFERWELEDHLYSTLGPGTLFPEFHLTYHHKQRWLAVELHANRTRFIEEAKRFSARRRGRREEDL